MKPTIASALTLLSLQLVLPTARAQTQTWMRQFGSSADDEVFAAAADDAGGVYVCGSTLGNLGGPNAGGWDAWLAHYDSVGNQDWIRQLGSSGVFERAWAAAPDGSGGVYVGGHTTGSLAGTSAGIYDVWLARYDSAGNQLWIRQFGTSGADYLYGAASDGTGGVVVGGKTDGSLGGPFAGGSADGWLARYDGLGNQLWIRQFGTSTSGEDRVTAAAPGAAGAVFVVGETHGSLGGSSAGVRDAWIARYDSAGTRTWIRQFGTTGNDYAVSAAEDGSGGAYLAGYSTGASFGNYLRRYDNLGNLLWVRQPASTNGDAAPDGSGGVYMTVSAGGLLGLARYDSAGNQSWVGLLLTLNTGDGGGILSAAADGSSVYAGGLTGGSLGGPNMGGSDVWLARWLPCGAAAPFCTPSTTTNGCSPSISGTGSASASAGSGFTISINGVEGAQSGLIFYGLSGAVAFPWGTSTSYMCVKSPLERTPVQNSGGTLGLCDGVLSIDWNAYIATHPSALGNPFVGGEQVRAQAWFRDPPSPKTTSLSNGLQFSVCP